jgi:hypothetical protein
MANEWTEQVAALCGREAPEFVYGTCQPQRVEYEMTLLKIHHSHTNLLNDETLVQHTVQYYIVKILALYIREDELNSYLASKGFWQGKPSVTPMIPNSRFGYYQVSGTYLKATETEEDEE